MPKKKGQNKSFPKDVTIAYFANAEKPAIKPKKVSTDTEVIDLSEIAWDEIPDNIDINIVKNVNSDGTTNFICTKGEKLNTSTTNDDLNSYPEIIWYLISRHIDPKDTGRFALINKTTMAITHQKSFWLHLYEKYCKHSILLPSHFKIEDEPKIYGLKTRVILALYNTHKYFITKSRELTHQYINTKPHELIKRQCVDFNFSTQSSMFFKFKKKQEAQQADTNFMRELDRLDANPEQGVKLLQVNFHTKCVNSQRFLQELQVASMGLVLTSVKMGLSSSLSAFKLVLGFSHGSYVNKSILPELIIPLEPVKSVNIYDWWHPNYPRFHVSFSYYHKERGEDEDEPVLKRDFFAPLQL